jgi:hypothetical protein
MERGEEGEG